MMIPLDDGIMNIHTSNAFCYKPTQQGETGHLAPLSLEAICICGHGAINSHRKDDYGQPKCDYCNGPCDMLGENGEAVARIRGEEIAPEDLHFEPERRAQ